MSTTETNLTHFDASGNAVMVDVSEKTVTFREPPPTASSP